MFCRSCGAKCEEGASLCKACRAKLDADGPVHGFEGAAAVYKDTLGTVSLVLSIVSLFLGGGLLSAVAIVLGAMAKKKADAVCCGSNSGRIGIILGIIGVILYAIIFVVFGTFAAVCVAISLSRY